jgi:hypothetical protein
MTILIAKIVIVSRISLPTDHFPLITYKVNGLFALHLIQPWKPLRERWISSWQQLNYRVNRAHDIFRNC